MENRLQNFKIILSDNCTFVEYRFARLFQSLANEEDLCFEICKDEGKAHSGVIYIGRKCAGQYEYVVAKHENGIDISARSLYAYESLLGYIRENSVSGVLNSALCGKEIRTDIRARLLGAGELIHSRTPNTKYRIMYHNIWGWNESETNPTEQRNMMLGALYSEYAPDVLCLVECTAQMRNPDKSSVIADLEGRGFVEVDSPIIKDFKTATPILYNPERMEVLESGTYKFAVGGGNDKFATHAVLKGKDSANCFGVISVHLAYQQTPEGEEFRLLQVPEVMQIARDIQSKYNCSVIIGGDMNCWTPNAPYKKFGELGARDIRDYAKISDDLGTAHPYPTYNSQTGLMERKEFSPRTYSDAALDHIFFIGEDFEFGRFATVNDNYTMCTSDHCPIVIDFNV